MTGTSRDKSIDERNKEAPHLNPTKSGIRSGNKQLDPEPDHHPPQGEERRERPAPERDEEGGG